MKRVVATGTFDILHEGHIHFLREAKKLGDWLGVVVARDSTVLHVKGHTPIKNEQERRMDVETLGIADVVVLGYPDDKYQILEELEPDIIALGYDQKAFTDKLEEELKNRGLASKVVRISPFHPETFKSSLLSKKDPKELHSN